MTAPPRLTMSAVMRPALLSCVVATAFLAPHAAWAQPLVTERIQGNQRICYYGAENGLLTGQLTSRPYGVGLAENCPVTYPVVDPNQPAPPTAALRSDTVVRDRRICIYERWGSSWTFSLPERNTCPPAAGMIPREPAATINGPAGR